MTKEELTEFLKENLKIKTLVIEDDRGDGHPVTKVKVILKLNDEKISSSTFSLDEHYD